jgi:hypothetical protein
MISWRSFTTSKVLPTFVGESVITGSTSYSRTQEEGFDQQNFFRGAQTETSSQKYSANPTLTYLEFQRGATAALYSQSNGNFLKTGQVANDGSVEINSTIVIKNSTIRRGTFTQSSPLRTVFQETTTTNTFEKFVRISSTISIVQAEDDEGEGPAVGEPIIENVWTTFSAVQTDSAGKTKAVTSFDYTTRKTTEIIQSYTTIPSTRSVITTFGEALVFETYTQQDGDIILVENTIWENSPFYEISVATVNSPSTDIPVTSLSYAPSRFTVFYSEAYTTTLPVRHDSASTIPVTTRTTQKSGHEITRVGFSSDTYNGWRYSVETRSCKNRGEGVTRQIPVSFQNFYLSTFSENTRVNTTTSTFETINGPASTTEYSDYTTKTAGVGSFAQRTRTFFVANIVSEKTTRFEISSGLVTTASMSWPGLVNSTVFPWISLGNNNRRYYSISNQRSSLISSTSRQVTFGNTWEITYYSTMDGGPGTQTVEWQNKKQGQFFVKRTPGLVALPQNGSNAATAIRADFLQGLASPALTYATQNTHSSVGVFMTANAQHTWEGGLFGIPRGDISQNIVGAIPIYPTFTGIIRNDAQGWELCDSSDYTTVRGERVGAQFSTTIAWQEVESSLTKNKTASGTFTMNSTSSAEFGVRQETQTIAGGFQTPNAARTVIVSPGVVATTTYDASGSGTGSISLPTGTSFISAPTGPVPITLSSFLRRVQGYGVITQQLLDNGLP